MHTADKIIDQHVGLWWSDVPKMEGHQLGCLGGFQTMTPELLEKAEAQLREAGCTLAVGPMMGNTWRTHRAVIESNGREPFLLEPVTDPELASFFQAAGYDTLAEYSSSLIDLSKEADDFSRIEARMSQANVTIRSLQLEQLENELKRIYDLSLRAFTDNFLYTPISQEEFLAMYLKIAPMLNTDCAFLAECQGDLVGFVFGFPQASTIIVKTLAVLPERRFAGLGTLLVHRMQVAAKQSGCTEAIHALQREDNQSLRISKRFAAQVFRRYALFSKPL